MLSPVEPWVPGGVQADRGIWETEGPREPGLTFPHSSPAEASQQMAELSEVLALRMENYEHTPQNSCLGILWTEEPGRLQSIGSHRLGHH